MAVGLLLIGLAEGFAVLGLATGDMDGLGVGSRVTGTFVGKFVDF